MASGGNNPGPSGRLGGHTPPGIPTNRGGQTPPPVSQTRWSGWSCKPSARYPEQEFIIDVRNRVYSFQESDEESSNDEEIPPDLAESDHSDSDSDDEGDEVDR